MLELVRCEDDYCSRDIDALAKARNWHDVDAIRRVTVTASLCASTAPNAERLPLGYACAAAAIENPFLSECGRFSVSPTKYGLDEQSASVFLRAMPMDQLHGDEHCNR